MLPQILYLEQISVHLPFLWRGRWWGRRRRWLRWGRFPRLLTLHILRPVAHIQVLIPKQTIWTVHQYRVEASITHVVTTTVWNSSIGGWIINTEHLPSSLGKKLAMSPWVTGGQISSAWREATMMVRRRPGVASMFGMLGLCWTDVGSILLDLYSTTYQRSNKSFNCSIDMFSKV